MENKKSRKFFFGWTNIKWFIKELFNVYSSSKKSVLSKKRLESGIAFFIGQIGMVFFLIMNHKEMTTSDLAIWAGIEFAISGYMVTQIQKEKRDRDYNNIDDESQDDEVING